MSPAPACSSCCTEVNVSPKERVACGFLSGLLLAKAIRGEHGVFSLLAAGALAFRALSGHCVGYAALGVKTNEEP
jgi:hypothetical protein